MELFNKLGKKTSATAANVMNQAKNLSEATKLSGLVTEEEKKIDNFYYQIGKLYYSTHKNSYEDMFANLISAVLESENKINSLHEQIQDIKGVVRCEKCGAEVGKDMAFCSSCGAPVPKHEPVLGENQEKCDSCGAIIEKGMRFCTSCGAPMKQENVQPAVIKPIEPMEFYEENENSFCANCGSKLEAGVAFCTECGTKIE